MNNPIIKHKFSCDPTALVYQNTVYLITGHDEAPVGTEDYVMNDWLSFSSPDKDFLWAKGDAYASKLVERNSMFYFYAAVSPANGKEKAIGVAEYFPNVSAEEPEQ